MTSKEQRRAARAKHDSVMEIFDEAGHFITGIGRLVNFSSVGVCFSSTRAFKNGEKIRARMRLLREGGLEISAHVVWARKKPNTILYGLEFDSVRKIRPS